MRSNDKGFTLIEVVVTFAILSILTVAVYGFAIVASNTYQRQTKDVEVQYEAQLVTNQIHELAIDTGLAVSYSHDAVTPGTIDVNVANMGMSDADFTATATKELAIYNKDRYYVLQWVKADEKIYYYEYEVVAGAFVCKVDKVLMAEYVKDFKVDLNNVEQNGNLSFDLTFHRSKDYLVSQNVKLRNKVVVNKSLAELYP